MMKIYDDAVSKMCVLLKERNVCLHSRKAHIKCYSELREYLSSVEKEYSIAEARKWLRDEVQKQEYPAGFLAKWHYVDQLEELINTGTVMQDHLLLGKSNYQKLSYSLRYELDKYLKESCECKYTGKTMHMARLGCSSFLLFQQERGIFSVESISCKDVIDFFKIEMPISEQERYFILGNARRLLQYYVSIGKCEPVLPLLLDENVYKYAALEVDVEQSYTSDGSFTYNLDELYSHIDSFVREFEKLGYQNTVKSNSAHIVKCLYAFLKVNKLPYSYSIAELWYKNIEGMLGSSYHSWIRVINMFDLYIHGEQLNHSKKYTFRKSRDFMYPEWCSSAVNDYLFWLRRSFHSESTVRSYKYTVYNFCDFLLQKQLNSFKELNKSHINEFLNIDYHSTRKGISKRNTVLRQFLIHLENNHYLEDKVHGMIPSRLAQSRKIIEILSDAQISVINEYRKMCQSPIALRDAAMVMIGLKLGFRCSDVVNLKFSDIDWVNKKISIVQYKTKSPLVLPLGIEVGNAIFRYLKYGRPESDSPYVFVRHKSPYGKLSGKICSNALNRILSTAGNDSKVKFHTLRKTFATNILKNNAGIDRVIDALGHQDSTTVNVYLTYDKDHMRKCALSLEEMSIQIGGAKQ